MAELTPLHADPIDEAIAKTEPEAPGTRRMKADFVLPGGSTALVDVPYPFGADEFESVVAILMQLRVASDQQVEADKSKGLITPAQARGGLILPGPRGF